MSETFEIQLNSGRTIQLRSFNQSLTYEGLLDGIPTKQLNQRIIKFALEDAGFPHSQPYLIPPIETDPEYHRDRKYPFGDPADLPTVRCIARFKSFTPARDPSQYISWLIIVWFQEQFGLPLDEEIEAHIKAMDWDAVALDDEP